MQKTISKGVISDQASYLIVNQYGWKPRACFEIICSSPGYSADYATMISDIEETLWQTVKGRIYQYDETFVRDLDCGVVVTIYFEHTDDAVLFKLAFG